MSSPRKLAVSLLAGLACAGTVLGTPAPASARPTPFGALRSRSGGSPASSACNRSSARSARLIARTARRCRQRPTNTRAGKPAKQLRPRSLNAASATPEAPPAAAPAPSTAPSASASTTAHAAAIAAVLATPCQNTELTPEAANLAAARAAVLCLINHKRAENGESPLKLSAQLEQAAEGHCQELIADDYFAHVSPTGETPVDRIRETGYIPNANVGYVIGENLAWGTYQLSTPQAIVAAWIASPGHLANILEAQYTETGIGITPAVPASLADGAPGATYAQEFGVIIQ